MTSNQERNELATMHGLPNNNPRSLRDASGSSTPWKKKPTAIPAPANADRRYRSEADRYDFSNRLGSSSKNQKKNNSIQKKDIGNVTAKKMGQYAPPNKRQKLDSGAKKEMPILAPDFSDEIIPNHPSTDDLNITDTPYFPGPIPVQCEDSSNSKAGPSRIVPDGSSTRWLEKRRKSSWINADAKKGTALGEDPDDGIESDGVVELLVPPGLVQVRRTQLENASKQANRELTPKIDLKKAQKLKTGMKPRDPRSKPIVPGDDSMPSSTPFTKSSNKTSPLIPIASAFIGHRMYPEKGNEGSFFLKWGINKTLVIFQRIPSGGPRPVATFYPEEHFSSMTYTANAGTSKNFVTVKIATRKLTNGEKKPELAKPSLFEMGDNFSGNIVFKLDDKSNEWSLENYEFFIEWLKPLVGQTTVILGYGAAHALWDETSRMSNLKDEAPSRKNDNFFHTRSTPTRLNTDSSESRAVSLPVKRPLREEDVIFGDVVLPSSAAQAGSNNLNGLRRSARNISAPSKSPALDADEVILVYPQGVPGAVNITNADLGRLQPGEFLNDTLIEFGLKYWHKELEITNPELAKQIHVFSSFFYKKLNKKKTEEGYDSVRKWTSKFDLFGKKYIIVPINENVHWYLAIIYEPEHILLPPPQPVPTPSTRKNMRRSSSKPPLPSVKIDVLDADASETGSTAPEVIAAEIELAPSTSSELEVKNTLSCVDFQGRVMISTANGLTTMKPGVADDIVIVSEATGGVSEDTNFPSSPLSPVPEDMVVDDEVDTSRSFRGPSPTVSEMALECTTTEATSRASSETTMDHDLPIPPDQFYAPFTPKYKRKAAAQVSESVTVEDESDNEVLVANVPAPKTYIFTMDSLGSRHPQATRQLARYLKLEAQDKKQLGEDMTSTAIGKVATVPFQPNYCDCGIYLLHLAKTFMTDPTGYYKKILETKNMANEERQKVWNDNEVAGIREALSNQIKQLSSEWKKQRAAKEEAKKEGKADGETVESSDDDIDIVETSIPAKPKGPTPRKKAARLR